jgi:hypothetical protein
MDKVSFLEKLMERAEKMAAQQPAATAQDGNPLDPEVLAKRREMIKAHFERFRKKLEASRKVSEDTPVEEIPAEQTPVKE